MHRTPLGDREASLKGGASSPPQILAPNRAEQRVSKDRNHRNGDPFKEGTFKKKKRELQ